MRDLLEGARSGFAHDDARSASRPPCATTMPLSILAGVVPVNVARRSGSPRAGAPPVQTLDAGRPEEEGHVVTP
jgi:hypothetical protein